MLSCSKRRKGPVNEGFELQAEKSEEHGTVFELFSFWDILNDVDSSS